MGYDIMARYRDWNRPWKGKIDDVRIYNRALSPQEIQELYTPNLNDGLVAYYPFNGNANDASGNNNHGTVYGATLTTDRFGNPNSAYSFDGNDYYIKASADNLPTAERTVSLWFYANTVNNRPGLLGYGGGNCGTSWIMVVNNWGEPLYSMGCHCDAERYLNYNYFQEPVGDWYHWTITTKSDGTKMYVNGVEKASNNEFFSNTVVDGKDLSFGVITGPSGFAPYTDNNSGYFNGKIDDIRIYNRALSAQEIQELYTPNLNDGLVAYYPFNGNANDESGNGNHGTVYGATLTTDRFGNANSAYSFDGENDYIKASADNLPTAERTVSLWFYANTVNNEPGLLGYGGNGYNTRTSWLMGLNICNDQSNYHMSCHWDRNRIDYYYSQEPIGNWYHWVVTTSVHGTKMYINSKEEASNINFVSDTAVNGKDLAFGVVVSEDGNAPYTDNCWNFFNGKLDEIRIYNRALSTQEIQQLYEYDDTDDPNDTLDTYDTSDTYDTLDTHDTLDTIDNPNIRPNTAQQMWY
jgi:hypothetical protein